MAVSIGGEGGDNGRGGGSGQFWLLTAAALSMFLCIASICSDEGRRAVVGSHAGLTCIALRRRFVRLAGSQLARTECGHRPPQTPRARPAFFAHRDLVVVVTGALSERGGGETARPGRHNSGGNDVGGGTPTNPGLAWGKAKLPLQQQAMMHIRLDSRHCPPGCFCCRQRERATLLYHPASLAVLRYELAELKPRGVSSPARVSDSGRTDSSWIAFFRYTSSPCCNTSDTRF